MNNRFHFSIQKKILLLIFVALAIFGVVSAKLSYEYYLGATIEQHKRLGVSTSALVASVINADLVPNFIKNGEKASGYVETWKLSVTVLLILNMCMFIKFYRMGVM